MPCVEILHGPMAFHPPGQLSSSANAGQSKQNAALQTLTLAQDIPGEESQVREEITGNVAFEESRKIGSNMQNHGLHNE